MEQGIQLWLSNQIIGVLFGAVVMGLIGWFFQKREIKDLKSRIKSLEDSKDSTGDGKITPLDTIQPDGVITLGPDGFPREFTSKEGKTVEFGSPGPAPEDE